MINKLIGEAIKIISMRHNPAIRGFEIECVLPGHKVAAIHKFDKHTFPNHTPILILDEHLQIGEEVYVWAKESFIQKYSNRGNYRGLLKGLVCLNEQFMPFIMIDGMLLFIDEVKCILKATDGFSDKDAEHKSPSGTWLYSSKNRAIQTPFFALRGTEVDSMLDLLRKAGLV